MKTHAILLFLLSAMFFAGGYFDRHLITQGKEPLLNTSQDIYKDGKTTGYRSPIYEAKVIEQSEVIELPTASGEKTAAGKLYFSISWKWKWLDLIIWLFLGLILHRLLKRIPKGTVA